MLDGVVLARKTGAGAVRRPVLVALGLRPDGKKEIIDFRLATAESAAQWELFLSDLYRRGLTGEGLEMICVDGGAACSPPCPRLPGIAVQRCWAHKIRNVLEQGPQGRPARRQGRPARIMNAKTLPAARSAARRFADRWQDLYPKPSAACATTSTTCSPASDTKTLDQRKASEPPTPSSGASARSAAEPGPWASSRTEPPWTASSSPSSPTKTSTRESPPSSP